MRTLRRIRDVYTRHGLRGSIVRAGHALADAYFDFKHGTETGVQRRLDSLAIQSDNRGRGTDYQASKVIPLRRFFREITADLKPLGPFVDLGCGKGRVLLIASEFGFRDIRGIEFSTELCQIARRNCEAFKKRTGKNVEFQIVETDVGQYSIREDEDVFFMFNPFDEIVLGQILKNISASLDAHPRRISLIYNHPRFGELIEAQSPLSKTRELSRLGFSFALYQNQV